MYQRSERVFTTDPRLIRGPQAEHQRIFVNNFLFKNFHWRYTLLYGGVWFSCYRLYIARLKCSEGQVYLFFFNKANWTEFHLSFGLKSLLSFILNRFFTFSGNCVSRMVASFIIRSNSLDYLMLEVLYYNYNFCTVNKVDCVYTTT